ncbi:MAG TPA: enoyl-CoA hydratase-related protein [Thermodesulfobacteriota bacterium]
MSAAAVDLAATRHGAVAVLAGAPGPADRWLRALADALASLEADRSVRAVVVAGWGDRPSGGEGAAVADEVRRRFREGRLPVVAALDGHVGGPALAAVLETDVRIAAETARVAAAGIDGAPARCVARLVHLLGEAGARDVALTGRTLDARDARRVGLVSRVVPAASLLEEARAAAGTIASRAPLAVAAARRAVRQARDLGPAAALAMEHDLFARLVETRDHKAAVAAFFAGTRPVFRGE